MRFLPCSLVPAFLLALPAASAAQPVIFVPGTHATLQAAINSIDTVAEDGTIIEMANGTHDYGTFVTISNKPYRFTVRAATGATVRLSGGGSHDILRFLNGTPASGRPVVFERLIFENGFSSTDGLAGAILMSHAEATFVSCTFRNNVANPPNQGGAGVYLSGSRAHFVDALFSDNTSKNWGAGLAVVSTPSFGSTAFVHNSRFSNNRVNLPNHLPYSSGGAIFATDGAAGAPPVVLRITNTRFEGNQAGYVSGAIQALGFWTAPESTPKVDLLCTNCTFINNVASRDPSVSFPFPTQGGAVHVEDQTTARFVNSRFITNTAREGGALSNYRAKLEVVGGTFQGNQATGSGGAEGLGGAILLLSDDNNDASTGNGTINRRPSELTVRDTLFQGRYGAVTTTGRQGGCLFLGGDTNRAWGLNGLPQMGDAASNRATVSLESVIINDCDVAGDGSLPGAGGGLFGSLLALTAVNTLIANSNATGGNPIFPAGGGMALTNNSAATLTQTTLAKNSALSGGAIWSFGGTLNLAQCGVYENSLISGNLGSAINTSYDPGGGGRPAIGMSGLIQTSVVSNNSGSRFLYEMDQSSAPFNTVQYASNQIFPSTNVYWNPLAGGDQNVSQLNSLVLHSQAKGVSNVGLVSAPVAGALVAAPPSILSTNAAGDPAPPTVSYLGYAWTGGSATVNGGAVAGNAGLQAATFSGTQTLQVGASSFTDTVTAPAAPFLYLSANPGVLAGPGTSVLSWTTVSGSWLTNDIDQGTVITPAVSGGSTVALNATTTYRGFLVAEEGGSVDSHSIWVSSDLIFRDGFQ
ncbi:MAG TPA: hypothetical protein VJU18_02670 [Vicinamibacteria bacterium]|nr:hypothetical protein [Vicinamibacteria bacterium]